MRKNIKLVLFFDFVLAILLIIIDQITKRWASTSLKQNGPIQIINNVLEFYYLPEGNKGAAFGMLQGQQVLFLIIAIVVVVAIAYLLVKIPLESRYLPMRILLVFIAAGGIGNMIDRAVLNYVVDFVYISIINFPIFNVADIYVSVSTVILALYVVFYYKDEDFKKIEVLIKNKKER